MAVDEGEQSGGGSVKGRHVPRGGCQSGRLLVGGVRGGSSLLKAVSTSVARNADRGKGKGRV